MTEHPYADGLGKQFRRASDSRANQLPQDAPDPGLSLPSLATTTQQGLKSKEFLLLPGLSACGLKYGQDVYRCWQSGIGGAPLLSPRLAN